MGLTWVVPPREVMHVPGAYPIVLTSVGTVEVVCRECLDGFVDIDWETFPNEYCGKCVSCGFVVYLPRIGETWIGTKLPLNSTGSDDQLFTASKFVGAWAKLSKFTMNIEYEDV